MAGTGPAGRVAQISVSRGGVPKRAVAEAAVTAAGVEGDSQADLRYHGGPERAVCLFSLEVIERLRAEGHPIAPGTAGENLTLAGIPWPEVAPGSRLVFDSGVVLEVTKECEPCGKIHGSFADGAFRRIDQERHPGESRFYARVLAGGTLRVGEGVRLEGGPAGG
jgi:MOSC domain-containing protein YiiM